MHRGQSLHAASKQSRDAGVGTEGMTLKMSISKAELLKMLTEISGISRLACEQRKIDCVESPLISRPRSSKVSGHLLWSMLGSCGSRDQSCLVILAGQQGKQLYLGLLL